MACRRYARAVTGAAAGEAISAGLAAHLDVCPACAATLDDLRHSLALVDEELASIGSIAVPPALAARVSQRLDDAAPGPLVAWTNLGIASATLAIVLVMAAGYEGCGGRHDDPSVVIAVGAPEPPSPPARIADRPVAPRPSVGGEAAVARPPGI